MKLQADTCNILKILGNWVTNWNESEKVQEIFGKFLFTWGGHKCQESSPTLLKFLVYRYFVKTTVEPILQSWIALAYQIIILKFTWQIIISEIQTLMIRGSVGVIYSSLSNIHFFYVALLQIGRSKWNGNVGSSGFVLRLDAPLSNVGQPSFSVQINSGIEFWLFCPTFMLLEV